MTKLNKILIAALGAQVLLIAVVWASRDAETIPDPEPVIADFDPEAVERVEIFEGADDEADAAQDGEAAPAVALARDGEGFRLDSAHGYPADAGRVDELLTAMANMKSREPVATSEGRARQLEVASDAYDRKVVVHTEGETRTLYLGAPAGRGRIAARVEGQPAIHGVDSAVGRSARIRAEDWARQPYFEVDVEQIASLSVENEHLRAAFVRGDDGAWQLAEESEVQAPEGQVLDGDEVDEIARAVARLRMASVAGGEPAPEHGLDEPRARVELALAPPEGGEDGEAALSVAEDRRVLVFGAEKDESIHVRDEQQPFVVLVRRSAVREALNAEAEDLFATEEELEEQEAAAPQAPAGMPGAAQMPPGGGAIAPPTP